MGGVTEGVLARRRILATPTRPAERLLAQDRWHERVHRPLPPFPGMLSEPPGADPHAGWCGRGQGKPGLYPIVCPANGYVEDALDRRRFRCSERFRVTGCST